MKSDREAASGIRKPSNSLRGPIFLSGLAILAWVALFPVTTKQAVNYHITSRQIPFYLKGMEFLVRDAHYRRLVREIAHGLKSDEVRAVALFNWTREHILPTPRGFPLMDDHIFNIVIRGYGEADQMADVFTTLSAYAGVPAFWKIIISKDGKGKLVLSFVRIDEHWTVWDVERGIVFRNEQGKPSSISELVADPAIVETYGVALYHEQPYRWYIERGLESFAVPGILRAEEQMPFHRLLAEVRRAWQRLWSPRVRSAWQ